MYITFQHTEGYDKGLESFNGKQRHLPIPPDCKLVPFLKFKKAPNPSSIIWENRAAFRRIEQRKQTAKLVVMLIGYEIFCSVIIYLVAVTINK
jgi:hypothetical protein